MVLRSRSKSPSRLSPSHRRRKSRSPSRSHKRSHIKSPKVSSYKKSPARTYKRSSHKRSKSKSPVRIHLTKGSLGMYGYKDVSTKTSIQRRGYLAKALKHEDALPVFRKLNALYVVNKNRNPSLAAIFESDRNWVQSKYM